MSYDLKKEAQKLVEAITLCDSFTGENRAAEKALIAARADMREKCIKRIEVLGLYIGSNGDELRDQVICAIRNLSVED